MMNYEEFTAMAAKRIKDFLPDDYLGAEALTNRVLKNNSERTALNVKRQEARVSANIYLEDFYNEYLEGKKMNDILMDVANLIVESDKNAPGISDISIDMFSG